MKKEIEEIEKLKEKRTRLILAQAQVEESDLQGIIKTCLSLLLDNQLEIVEDKLLSLENYFYTEMYERFCPE